MEQLAQKYDRLLDFYEQELVARHQAATNAHVDGPRPTEAPRDPDTSGGGKRKRAQYTAMPSAAQLAICANLGGDSSTWSPTQAVVQHVADTLMDQTELLQWARESFECGAPDTKQEQSLIKEHISAAIKRFITNTKAAQQRKRTKLNNQPGNVAQSECATQQVSLPNVYVSIEQIII